MYLSLYVYIYIYIQCCPPMLSSLSSNVVLSSPSTLPCRSFPRSGSCRCTLIGVPCRLSMLSTFSTFANVLFQYTSPLAEGAKTDPPPGYTYEGTQTTA